MSADLLEGKVGRIYMPKQDVGGMALHKMKARPSLCPNPDYETLEPHPQAAVSVGVLKMQCPGS